MRWDEIGEMPCSVARTLSVIGDRWTVLILRDCFLGARRFDHFAASLDVSPHVLSTRLGKLVEHGILDRRAYQDHPVRHEYRLTEKGRDLYPVLGSMLQWGDRWMSGPEGPPARVRHRLQHQMLRRKHPQTAAETVTLSEAFAGIAATAVG